MKVGVLAIQGSVIEHFESLKRLKVDAVLVKKVEDLEGLSGIIIPGGESTTIGKLLSRFGLDVALKNFVASGGAVWGTCAGAILLAKEIAGRQQAQNLDLMDIVVERNSYGRQQESFETTLEFGNSETSTPETIAAMFIRAPRIVSVGQGVEILARYGDDIVAVRQGKLMATTFHPELTGDDSVHRYFLEMCKK